MFLILVRAVMHILEVVAYYHARTKGFYPDPSYSPDPSASYHAHTLGYFYNPVASCHVQTIRNSPDPSCTLSCTYHKKFFRLTKIYITFKIYYHAY